MGKQEEKLEILSGNRSVERIAPGEGQKEQIRQGQKEALMYAMERVYNGQVRSIIIMMVGHDDSLNTRSCACDMDELAAAMALINEVEHFNPIVAD